MADVASGGPKTSGAVAGSRGADSLHVQVDPHGEAGFREKVI